MRIPDRIGALGLAFLLTGCDSGVDKSNPITPETPNQFHFDCSMPPPDFFDRGLYADSFREYVEKNCPDYWKSEPLPADKNWLKLDTA